MADIVGPDLGSNYLQRLSADDKSWLAGKELKNYINFNWCCGVFKNITVRLGCQTY